MKQVQVRTPVLKAFFVFLGVVGLGLLFTKGTEAVVTSRVFLDASAARHGYTVTLPDDSARLGVLPGVLSRPSRVVLTAQDEITAPPAPPGFERVTPYVSYLLAAADVFPAVPPAVALPYASERTRGHTVVVAYYVRSIATWRFVPSSDVRKIATVRTRLPFRAVSFAGFVRTTPPTPSPPSRVAGSSAAPSVSTARAVVVMDSASGAVLFARNEHEILPLASLTKLVTADTALDLGLDPSKTIPYGASESAAGATVSLAPGDSLSVNDALHAALVASANNAAKLLAHATGLSEQAFGQRMTQDARELGLSTPSFVEPTGLSSANRSSAYDFALLARHCLARLPILQATTSVSYGFRTRNTGRLISFRNTNFWLAQTSYYVTGSKTGYLPVSWGGIGSNLLMRARTAKDSRNDVIVLVMGEPSRMQAIADVDTLFRWAFASYRWNN